MEAAIAAAINGAGGGTVADMMENPAIMQALQVRIFLTELSLAHAPAPARHARPRTHAHANTPMPTPTRVVTGNVL